MGFFMGFIRYETALAFFVSRLLWRIVPRLDQQVSPICEMLCVVLPHPHRQSFKRPGTLFPGASQDGKERNFALNCRAASLALTRCSCDMVSIPFRSMIQGLNGLR
jgi:hypothetical protein